MRYMDAARFNGDRTQVAPRDAGRMDVSPYSRAPEDPRDLSRARGPVEGLSLFFRHPTPAACYGLQHMQVVRERMYDMRHAHLSECECDESVTEPLKRYYLVATLLLPGDLNDYPLFAARTLTLPSSALRRTDWIGRTDGPGARWPGSPVARSASAAPTQLS